MSALDLLEHPHGVASHPRLLAARALARDLLLPHAERVDVDGVTRSHLDALAREGLLAPGAGDDDLPAAVARAVTEEVAAADGSTWFAATQHRFPLQLVHGAEPGPLRDRWLPGLASGALLAGVAVSHVRGPRPSSVVAERVDGGWALRGQVPWVTGWGLVDVVALAAVTDGSRDTGGADDEGEVVVGLLPTPRHQVQDGGPDDVPGDEAPSLVGVTATPLPLTAMGGTRTVAVGLDRCRLDDADVVLRLPLARWRRTDAVKVADANPAVFGAVRAAVRELEAVGQRRGDPTALRVARDLAAAGAAVRARAWHLLDASPPGERVDERVAVRAEACELAVRAAAAAVAATGGAAWAVTSPAQRVAREAMFHLVQAVTPPVRTAVLDRLVNRSEACARQHG